jgi:quinol monooxygenase YgiN
MTSYTREEIPGIALVGRMVAREGKRDELLHVLDEAIAVCSQHEPDGALTAIFHTSPTDPDLVVLYEHYPGRASLEFHRANYERIPAYGELRARMNDLLVAPVEIVEVGRQVARWTRTVPGLREASASSHTRYSREEIGGIAFVARFPALPGKGQELLAVLEEAVPPQAAYEADPALVMDFATSAASPDTILFYKHYPTVASRDEHTANGQNLPGYRDRRLRMNALLAAPTEIVEQMTPVVRFTRTPKTEEKHQ